ncbi:MAG: hypothetical protein IPG50_17540 [Myxococcales bacterium]|nr:hypothetical protein [Myxococcales bacterium]
MVKMGAIAFAARTARRVAAPAAVAAAITTLLLANSCIGENPPYSDVVSDAQVSDSQVSEGDGSSDGGSAVDGSSDSAAPANPRTLFGGFSSSFCAIKKDKRLRCWGSRLGLHLMRADGGTSAIPVDLPFDAPIESVSMGILHACAISAADKGLYCWGVNAGWAAPPEAVRDRAERVASPEQFSAVAAGFGFTCAITTPKRSVRCFGTDEFGRLGPGPGLEVGGFDDVVSIGVGLRHACAVRATGEVTCWGATIWGSLAVATPITTRRAQRRCPSGLQAPMVTSTL